MKEFARSSCEEALESSREETFESLQEEAAEDSSMTCGECGATEAFQNGMEQCCWKHLHLCNGCPAGCPEGTVDDVGRNGHPTDEELYAEKVRKQAEFALRENADRGSGDVPSPGIAPDSLKQETPDALRCPYPPGLHPAGAMLDVNGMKDEAFVAQCDWTFQKKKGQRLQRRSAEERGEDDPEHRRQSHEGLYRQWGGRERLPGGFLPGVP